MGDAPTGPVVDGEGERPTPATAGSILVEAGRRQLDNAGTWILAGLCWAAIAFGLVGLGFVFVLLMWTAAAGTGDNRGEQVGILAVAATLFAAAGLVVSIVFVRSFPDLRGRDASPHPDTEPVAVTPS